MRRTAKPKSYWHPSMASKANFLAAAALFCTISHVRDPQTEKMGWLIKCDKSYLTNKFDISRRRAVRIAKDHLKAQRAALTVSLQELRHER